MRKFATALLLAAAVGTVGCYHATVETGLQPNGTKITQKWAMSFVSGLVPPPTVETAAKCPNGVARVETYHSFLNMLVGIVTGGIVTPMTIEVECAAPRTGATQGNVLQVGKGDDAQQVMTAAVQQAMQSGEAVYVQF